MFSIRKMMMALVTSQLLLCLIGFNALGQTGREDELWFRAVCLMDHCSYLNPGKVHIVTKKRYATGKWKISNETRVDIVETANGGFKSEEVKNQGKKEPYSKENRTKDTEIKYNLEYSDLTLPFAKKVQPYLTILRKKPLKTCGDQECTVYNFRYQHPKGGTIGGKAWLGKDGIPIVVKYTTKSLPKEIPSQYHSITTEVYYRHDNHVSWYPDKVIVYIKPRIGLLLFTPQFCMEFTFGGYYKSKFLEAQSGGKPVNQLLQPYTIPFEYTNGNLYAKVKLNDKPDDYRFIVDTGAATTVVNPRIVSRLGLQKVTEVEVSDGYVSKKADVVVIDKIALGEVGVENSGAMVFDFENMEKNGLKVDGILGSNFLRFLTIRINYVEKTLTFSGNTAPFMKEIACCRPIPLTQGPTGLIFAAFKVSGSKTLFEGEIDTGSGSGLSVSGEYLEDMKPGLNCTVIASKGIVTKGAFGGSKGRLSRIREFTIGDLSYQNHIVAFSESSVGILLGNSFLSQFTVVIDYPGNRLYLSPLENQIFKTNSMSYGCFLEQGAEEKTFVTGVWEGSAADRGGLRVGDVILRVVAGEESATTFENIENMMASYSTVHLWVQRDNGETEIVLKKELLLPEVE